MATVFDHWIPLGKSLRLKYREGKTVGDINYVPNYGFVAPSLVTTNGDRKLIEAWLHDDDLPIFNEWADSIQKGN